MRVSDLLEQRTKIAAAMRALHAEADASGDLPSETQTKFDGLKGELDTVEQRLQRQSLIDDLDRRAPGILLHGRGDGRFEERARDFSLVRAIRARCGDRVDDGPEREISQEVERRAGRAFQGIAVPDEYFLAPQEQRTLLVGSSAEPLYPIQHRPDLFIDTLRSALVVGRLGATVLNDLVGTQEIPRQTASSTAQHVAEDAALSETDAAFDDVTLAPKTVGSITSFSRRALINATPSVEALVRRDLAAVIANAIDFQAVFGTGLSNTPTGVVNQSDVHAATLVTPSWAEVLAFISAIQSADADLGSMGWLTHPRGVETLRATNKVSGEPEHGFIQMEPGSLAGFPLMTTSAVLSGGSPDTTSVVFGAWSQLIVGYWTGTDVLANPFSDAAYLRGRVQVRAMRDYDVAVRHGAAFAVATNLAV